MVDLEPLQPSLPARSEDTALPLQRLTWKSALRAGGQFVEHYSSERVHVGRCGANALLGCSRARQTGETRPAVLHFMRVAPLADVHGLEQFPQVRTNRILISVFYPGLLADRRGETLQFGLIEALLHGIKWIDPINGTGN